MLCISFLLPHKLTLFVLGAPNSVSLVYLVPPARSRYCASPEASIMRLKAAPKRGATASAPTQHFLPHKLTLFVLGAPNSVSLVYLVSFTPKTHDVPFWGPRSLARSRYCASPEASIMRLKAAPKRAAQFCGGPELRRSPYYSSRVEADIIPLLSYVHAMITA